MERTKNIIVTVTIALACFATSLVVFDSSVIVPSWLQVAGRIHPLAVHFPIGLFVLFIFYNLLFKKQIRDVDTALLIEDWLLLLSALSAVIAVIAGWVLSKDSGYEEDAVQFHKWFGIGTAAFTLLWYALRKKIGTSTGLNLAFCIAGLAGITIAGHQGASITHGEDYVFAPIRKEQQQPVVLLEDALVFNNMVQPVLEAKCVSCHNSSKAKGGLVMQTAELLLKGGKTGSLWDANGADPGLLLRRINLPEDQKKHMPPIGKTQLTDYETAVLTAWIKKGHDFKLRVADLPPTDSLYLLAANVFSTSENEVFDFKAADEKKVKALNTENRIVRALALESPALAASFYGAVLYKPGQLKELLAVKDQLVSLNLNKIPVKDEDLKTIAQFTNLRKLNLAFSNITGASLSELKHLEHLKQLSLSGVPLKQNDLKVLSGLPELTHIYIWNTGLQSNAIAALKQDMKKVRFETGFNGDTIVLQLNEPILENEAAVITDSLPLRLRHYVKGVTIRYTLDGSDPDSVSSPVYNSKVFLNSSETVKAKAFKAGWLASNTIEASFFKNTYKADSAVCLTPADKSFKGNGAATLVDGIKGETNFRTDKWLGFKDDPMEVLLMYDKPVNVSSITLTTVIDVNSFLMPPAKIEVWGGADKKHLKRLGSIVPKQPEKAEPLVMKGFDISFKNTALSCIKMVAIPVNRLPLWHPGKGQKGWIFVDEIFVN